MKPPPLIALDRYDMNAMLNRHPENADVERLVQEVWRLHRRLQQTQEETLALRRFTREGPLPSVRGHIQPLKLEYRTLHLRREIEG